MKGCEQNPTEISEALNIVSCSNAIPLKRLDLIAEALQKADFPIQWTHIGSGPTLEKISAMVESMPKNVTVSLLGQKSNEFVRDLYTKKHFDVFLNVSTTEGVPVSIMEALAAGIPVIATNVGGTSEIV
ncbi:MAG: glycosyltransferase, partial [Paludibacteraceae bacterium]|nr:glycosyltransferase [Paludibacteraceae bacterium]